MGLVLHHRGGAKKRKKKTYNKLKKLKQKKNKKKLAVLQFYKVNDSGKVQRLRNECPNAELCTGTSMANHFDRHYCGKCGLTYVYQKLMRVFVYSTFLVLKIKYQIPNPMNGVYEVDSISDEAQSFYYKYSTLIGFSVRKDDLRCDKNNSIVLRRWVCSREGHMPTKWLEKTDKVRAPKDETQVGYRVTFRVNFHGDTGLWIVSEFVIDHNHLLALPSQVQFIRSNRIVKDAVGVNKSQVLDLMVEQAGSYENMGCTRKDVQSQLDAVRRDELFESDSAIVLAYLIAKAEADSGFFFKYTLDENNRLENLFWADSTSKTDYNCFGDVLAFDSTYKTNVYQKPFVMFVGANHHRKTILFGFGLLVDEQLTRTLGYYRLFCWQ
ncbi:hypothetical protein Ddye_025959 [Dipteronia dyeriana]|uniref:Small ribosomal subunit protein eS31 domain-containing protein n=1 Tax=Dipteronia dyeriana TaxID=168575 RepID=A0AAD9TM64_9ROSI|nr:hypothetical protein Ddye_025959 [Dipteronia dyeriana]